MIINNTLTYHIHLQTRFHQYGQICTLHFLDKPYYYTDLQKKRNIKIEIKFKIQNICCVLCTGEISFGKNYTVYSDETDFLDKSIISSKNLIFPSNSTQDFTENWTPCSRQTAS